MDISPSVCLQSIHFFNAYFFLFVYEWAQDTSRIGPHRLNRVRGDCSCRCQPQDGINYLGRILPIDYPPQIMGLSPPVPQSALGPSTSIIS